MAEERWPYSIGVRGRKSEDVPPDWQKTVGNIHGVCIVEARTQSLEVLATQGGLRELRRQLDRSLFHVKYTARRPSSTFSRARVFVGKWGREV